MYKILQGFFWGRFLHKVATEELGEEKGVKRGETERKRDRDRVEAAPRSLDPSFPV